MGAVGIDLYRLSIEAAARPVRKPPVHCLSAWVAPSCGASIRLCRTSPWTSRSPFFANVSPRAGGRSAGHDGSATRAEQDRTDRTRFGDREYNDGRDDSRLREIVASLSSILDRRTGFDRFRSCSARVAEPSWPADPAAARGETFAKKGERDVHGKFDINELKRRMQARPSAQHETGRFCAPVVPRPRCWSRYSRCLRHPYAAQSACDCQRAGTADDLGAGLGQVDGEGGGEASSIRISACRRPPKGRCCGCESPNSRRAPQGTGEGRA